METGLLLTSLLLIAFALLAIIDGFYLHIFNYRLHARKESRFEHLTHTIRAFLFPVIIYSLFLNFDNQWYLIFGIFFVIADLVVLTMDAFSEKDSRTFMGGLPRWEYILHLFSNAFHFAAIAVFFAVKIRLTSNGIEVRDISELEYFNFFSFIAENLIPGSVLLAFVHLGLMFTPFVKKWEQMRSKITCC